MIFMSSYQDGIELIQCLMHNTYDLLLGVNCPFFDLPFFIVLLALALIGFSIKILHIVIGGSSLGLSSIDNNNNTIIRDRGHRR